MTNAVIYIMSFLGGLLLGISCLRQPQVAVTEVREGANASYTLYIDGVETELRCMIAEDTESCSDLTNRVKIKGGILKNLEVKRQR